MKHFFRITLIIATTIVTWEVAQRFNLDDLREFAIKDQKSTIIESTEMPDEIDYPDGIAHYHNLRRNEVASMLFEYRFFGELYVDDKLYYVNKITVMINDELYESRYRRIDYNTIIITDLAELIDTKLHEGNHVEIMISTGVEEFIKLRMLEI